MPLKIRLLLLYACVGIAVLAVVGSVLFVQVRNNRSADLEQEFQNQLMHLDFALTNLIEEAESDVLQLSDNDMVRTTDDEDFTSFLTANESTFQYNIGETEQSIIDILNEYRTTHDYVNSAYMGRENGTFVRSHPRASPTQYDPRDRPWYILGKENPGRAMITEPYESVTTTDVNIGVVTALVGDDGEVYGVVGADITLNNLTDYMSDFEVGYQGNMLLADENGTIVAFSDSDFLFENLDVLLGDTAADIMNRSQGIITVDTESGSYYLYLYTSPELGWKLAVMAPTGVINGVIQGPVFIALFGLFIALALLSFLTFIGLNKSVLNPLKRLSEVTRDITASGDLSRKTGITARNEIGTLSSSFDHMMDTLREKKEALGASEMRYRRLFEEAQDGILLLDAETGAVMNANPYLMELLGFSHEQLIGKVIWELGTFRDIVPDRDRFLELQRQGYIRYDDLPLTTGDGRQIYVEFISNCYIVGQKTLVQCAIRNITERKRAEAALRESENKYREVVERANDGIIILQDGIIKYSNQRVLDIAGFEEREIIGTLMTNYIHPDELTKVMDHYKRRIAGEQIPSIYETAFVHKDGRKIDVELNAGIIKYQGKPADMVIIRDITERKRSEQALHDAKDYAENLIKTANVLIVVLDTEGKVTLLNEAGEKTTGYETKEVIGKNWFNLIVPRERYPYVWDEFEKLKSSGAVTDNFENPILTKIGDERIISWKNSTLTLNGEFIGTLSFGMDITERKRAEEALQESETKYRFLTEKMNDVVWTLDMDLNTTYVSPSVTKMLGYTPGERMKQSVTEQLTPESLNYVMHALSVELERDINDGVDPDRRMTVEMECYHKNGSTIWMEAVVSAIRDEKGKIIGIHGVSRDVTERRKAEEALRNSEEKLRVMFRSMTDGVLVTDSNINIIDANETTLRILGLKTKEDLIGRNVLDVVKFKDQEKVTANLLRMANERLAQVHGEYCAILLDGTEMETEVITSAMFNDSGSQIGFINVIRDITERKRAEKELLLYKEHLEELVKERTSQLDAAKLTAEHANKAKSDFLANMSHEIRTPLSTIIGFSELLYDETKGPLNADQKKYQGYVTSAGEHLLSLINDILDLSKVEAGKMELMLTRFPMADLLKNSLTFVTEKALKHNINLVSNISANVDMIEADERKVKQVLYNLLSNAVKFTPDGGSVTMSADIVSSNSAILPAKIRKGLPDTKHVLVSVKDTGIGIARKDQDKIFTEFHQIEEPYAKKYEGTGLGLALSKRLVTLHGGKIWFESKGKDQGCTFYFVLPLKQSSKAQTGE